jgi:hypothetical protein
VTDIVTFAKQGNLPMVHGLINYFRLGQNVGLVSSGVAGTFEAPKGKDGNKLNTAQWNPLLVAIANRKLEIVRYLTNDVKISVAATGELMLALNIVVANQDLAILTELWTPSALHWGTEHLTQLVKIVSEAKWVQGLAFVLKSELTAALFRSLST